MGNARTASFSDVRNVAPKPFAGEQAWNVRRERADGSDPTRARAPYFFVPAYAASMAPVVVKGHFATRDRPLDAGATWLVTDVVVDLRIRRFRRMTAINSAIEIAIADPRFREPSEREARMLGIL
jgi:hypothetical protein